MIERIDESLCDGCGVCEDACPMDVIRVGPEVGTARIANPEDCMTCYNCERLCAKGAVSVGPFVRAQPHVWRPTGHDARRFRRSR